MFGARRPGEQPLQLGESARTAAVLRRARALAGEARWVHRGRVRHGASLDDKLVFPAIAEVVLVSGRVDGLHQITDPGILFVSISRSSSRYAQPYDRPAILRTLKRESTDP